MLKNKDYISFMRHVLVKLIHGSGHRDALVAGGAIRDLYFDIQPTDLDIFLPVGRKDLLYWGKVLNLTGRDTIEYCKKHSMPLPKFKDQYKQDFSDDYDLTLSKFRSYYANKQIKYVIDVHKDGVKIQLIFVDCAPTRYVTHSFDLGLCQAVYTGAKLRYTTNFMKDRRLQQFTFVQQFRPTDEIVPLLSQSLDHVLKLCHKFPGYVPAINIEYKIGLIEFNQQLIQPELKKLQRTKLLDAVIWTKTPKQEKRKR